MNSVSAHSAAQTRGAVFGLAAAALFGVSAPLAKILLDGVGPVLLAGLLYLGAASGLLLYRAVRRPTKEALLDRADAVRLGLVVLSGGIIGPVLMLLGLARVSGLTGALLLNLEAPLTVLLAVVAFREHLSRQALFAAVLIFIGAGLLEVAPGSMGADTLGVLLLAGGALFWAIDNNLTQTLSIKDPFAIVTVKTLVAGLFNSAIGLFVVGDALPHWNFVLGALALGSLSYGLSVVLDAYALRLVGAAREAAFFATAPVFGVLGALVLLGDELRWLDATALGLMGLGLVFLLRDRHDHAHTHEALEHEHLHVHDDHHQHDHDEGVAPDEPHSHRHRHVPLRHSHLHVSDAHHRHRHL